MNIGEKFEKLRELRKLVNKELENCRGKKIISSSLDASVTLYLSHNFKEIIENIDLRAQFIVSSVEVIWIPDII